VVDTVVRAKKPAANPVRDTGFAGKLTNPEQGPQMVHQIGAEVLRRKYYLIVFNRILLPGTVSALLDVHFLQPGIRA